MSVSVRLPNSDDRATFVRHRDGTVTCDRTKGIVGGIYGGPHRYQVWQQGKLQRRRQRVLHETKRDALLALAVEVATTLRPVPTQLRLPGF